MRAGLMTDGARGFPPSPPGSVLNRGTNMDSHRELPGLVPNRPNRSGRREVRSLDAATMRVISPPPPPEEVFIDWLMSVPHDADLEAAARCKIALIDRRGKPGMIVSDNGTEFTCNAMLTWSEDNQIAWHFIAPGKPMQNGFL